MSSFGDFFQNIGNKISDGWNSLKQGVSNAWDTFTDVLSLGTLGHRKGSNEKGTNLIEHVSDSVSDGWNGLKQGVSKYTTFINNDPSYTEQNENEIIPIFDNPLDPRDKIGREIFESGINSAIEEAEEKGTILGTPSPVTYEPVENSSDTSLSLDENPANTQSDLYELWEREDSIRKETQEREDTAYQRAVEDMRKAGINPELLGVSPASSGGGITSATRKDYSVYTSLLNNQYELLKQEIQNNFQGSENEKDRVLGLLKSVITLAGISSVKLK